MTTSILEQVTDNPTGDLKKLHDELDDKNKRLASWIQQAGPTLDLKLVSDMTGDGAARVEQYKSLNTEVGELADKFERSCLLKAGEISSDRAAELLTMSIDELKSKLVREMIPNEGLLLGGALSGPTLGDLFFTPREDGRNLKAAMWEEGGISELKFANDANIGDNDLKTVIYRSAGWTPESLRTGRLEFPDTFEPTFFDAVPQETTTYQMVKWMAYSAYTNNAAPRSESSDEEALSGATQLRKYAQSTMRWTEQSTPVEAIGTIMYLSYEQDEDELGVRSEINTQLPFMVVQAVDKQLISGNGTSPNLRGLDHNDHASRTTDFDTLTGSPSKFDVLLYARKEVRYQGRGVANLCLLTPNDYLSLRLTKTADGLYLMGGPQAPVNTRFWGLRMVETENLTDGNMYVMDVNRTAFRTRRQLRLETSTETGDIWEGDVIGFKATIRGAMVIYRPDCVQKIENFPSWNEGLSLT